MSSGGAENGKKRRRHEEEDFYVNPVQLDEDDIDFETLKEKKTRTVRVFDNLESYLGRISEHVHKVAQQKVRQDLFMCLAKFVAAFRAFLLRIKLQCPLNIDPHVVTNADTDDLKDMLYLCVSLCKRIRLSAFATRLHCPKRLDDLYLMTIPFSKAFMTSCVAAEELR